MGQLILIVDDEQDLVSTLEYNLSREGYETRSAHDGRTALALARERPVPDLILLDLMLPDMPGKDVCREIRTGTETKTIPVMMLTAKGEETDRVIGFEIGADDYVVKPFSLRELLLRIRAILRRAQADDRPEDQTTFGLLTIDRVGHNVWVEGDPIELTALEFKLLETLLARKGRVQSRRQLLSDVWGIHAEVTTRTVDTHVKRLRQKLGDGGRYIETLRGVGYRFMASPEEATR
jgi:two-component system phosphate regulon response regulator PhoB